MLLLVAPFALGDDANILQTVKDARAKEAAKDWKAAEGDWREATKQNPTNGDYWLGLARSAEKAGDLDAAIPAYEKVIDLGIGFPSEYTFQVACLYGRKGDKANTLDWFRRAMKMGFRDVDSVSKNPDLKLISDNPEFRKLLSLDASKGSRDEGWRSDIGFLYQEIKAKGWSPFRKVPESEFDANVAKLVADVPKLDDVKIELGMMKLLADVGDGHTSMWGARRPEFGFALPVKFYWFEEGLYIVAAEPAFKDLLGAKVEKFGSKTPAEMAKAMEPYLSRDNDEWLKEIIPFRLRSTVFLNALGLLPDAHSATLTLRKLDGSVAKVDLPADLTAPDIWNMLPYPDGWVGLADSLPGPAPLYLKNFGASYWFEYLSDSKTLYFQYNHVRSEESEPIERFGEHLIEAIHTEHPDRLVIDLRWNNGGDTFVNDRLLKILLREPRLSDPGFLYLIVGRRTFSAAMNAASYFKRFFDPTFVGEPTGGKPNAAGDEVPFTLPYSGIVVNVSDVYWEGYWPEDHSVWIAPAIYAPPTFASFRAKQDPALNAILGH
ncbi:MAG TPA: tetratricopeptide repeat protein [Fimbriimonadaceae bacterium]|nr:tetratricopeptide repeat protein [Fimbriimonadaceae bacterium]